MPAKKAATAPAKAKRTPCDNHPERDAVHTTTASIHNPISLCAVCLRRSPHLAER